MPNLGQTRAAWEAQAESYDQMLTSLCMEPARRALELAGVTPGLKLLDIACGGGAVSIPAAQLGAEVVAVDYSSSMVGLLDRKARDLGLDNLEVRQMDGTQLEIDDDSFDIACSQLGIMLFPDRAKGLSELARVTKPGGTGIMSVLGRPERVQVLSLFFDAMVQTLPGFEMPRESPLFCLKDPDRLVSEMTDAGFERVEVDQFETALEVSSGEELWTTVMAGAPAITGLMRSLPEPQQAEVRSALTGLLDARKDAGGIANLPMAFNIGVGIKRRMEA